MELLITLVLIGALVFFFPYILAAVMIVIGVGVLILGGIVIFVKSLFQRQ
jgi:hypothetical protein